MVWLITYNSKKWLTFHRYFWFQIEKLKHKTRRLVKYSFLLQYLPTQVVDTRKPCVDLEVRQNYRDGAFINFIVAFYRKSTLSSLLLYRISRFAPGKSNGKNQPEVLKKYLKLNRANEVDFTYFFKHRIFFG